MPTPPRMVRGLGRITAPSDCDPTVYIGTDPRWLARASPFGLLELVPGFEAVISTAQTSWDSADVIL